MFQDDLKEFLLNTFPDARPASGGKEVVLKCRFCGDSKDPRSKHFYISLGYDNKPPMFNCFKCNESGILSSKQLRMLSVYDSDMCISLDKHNTQLMKLPSNNIYKHTGHYKLSNRYISDNDLSNAKLGYINKRLGVNLSYQDLLDNKIILNLHDLLGSNNITKFTRHDNIVNQLSESFIGFISMDNSFINMRNLRPGKVYESIDKRYVNYNIFGNVDNSKRYYVIPNDVNLLNPNPIKIHIGEGPFDILSVFYNLRNTDKNHNIYASIGGKAYLNILRMFTQDLGLINIEFHIYIDNDITDWEISNIWEYMNIFKLNIYIHRNMFPGEKDFGVDISRIQEQITLLKGD